MSKYALNKVASAMQKRAGVWEDIKAGAYSAMNNPDTWRLAATYGAPIIGGGVLGALLNRKNRLVGALLGMGGGAAVGGGLHALQAYNVGGLGDWAKGVFDPEFKKALLARREANRRAGAKANEAFVNKVLGSQVYDPRTNTINDKALINRVLGQAAADAAPWGTTQAELAQALREKQETEDLGAEEGEKRIAEWDAEAKAEQTEKDRDAFYAM